MEDMGEWICAVYQCGGKLGAPQRSAVIEDDLTYFV